MVKVPALILMVTEDCNFHCKYCFQTKDKSYMSWETAKKAVDFFLPRMGKNPRLYFLGGEPLLAFDLIKKTIAYIKTRKKRLSRFIQYALTTNGSLLENSTLDFLAEHRFTVELSFDGLAQEKGRKENTFHSTAETLKKALLRESIALETNSTFTPGTVGDIYKSMEYILLELGVKKASLSLDLTKQWQPASIGLLAEQLAALRELLSAYYREHETIPVPLFRERKERGIWRCSAGSGQLTVTSAGNIWGCPYFYEYFKGRESTPRYKDFHFGELWEFVKRPRKKYRSVLRNYSLFRMDNYYKTKTRCFLCPRVEKCIVCPVARDASNSPLLHVPQYICEINKVLAKEVEELSLSLRAKQVAHA